MYEQFLFEFCKKKPPEGEFQGFQLKGQNNKSVLLLKNKKVYFIAVHKVTLYVQKKHAKKAN